MLRPDQEQSAGDNSVVVQSGGSTHLTVNNYTDGMLVEILGALAKSLDQFKQIAEDTVDRRLEEFKGEILKAFSDEKTSRREAFRDPDFMHVLSRAQYEYARSGESYVCENLVSLISRRSMEETRSRLSLSLNEAIDRAAVLTRNEFAELALCHALRYTQTNSGTIVDLSKHLNKFVIPLLADISKEHSSYQYLETHSCARISISGFQLADLFKVVHGGLFSRGFTREGLEQCLMHHEDKTILNSMIMPCIHDSTKLQFNALSEEAFVELSKQKNVQLPDHELKRVYSSLVNCMERSEMLALLSPHVPEIGTLFELWDSTPLQQLELTAVGFALGYCTLSRFGTFGTLSTWIK